jgi:hypothetical protein
MIYVIENQHGHVKIGYSRDRQSLRGRLSKLRTSSSVNPVVLAVGDGTEDDERGLHELLRQFHIQREWFGYREWRDPLLRNVVRLLPWLGAGIILQHSAENLRNFVSFPCVRGCVLNPGQYAGVRVPGASAL